MQLLHLLDIINNLFEIVIFWCCHIIHSTFEYPFLQPFQSHLWKSTFRIHMLQNAIRTFLFEPVFFVLLLDNYNLIHSQKLWFRNPLTLDFCIFCEIIFHRNEFHELFGEKSNNYAWLKKVFMPCTHSSHHWSYQKFITKRGPRTKLLRVHFHN